jgi:hypothetical protein
MLQIVCWTTPSFTCIFGQDAIRRIQAMLPGAGVYPMNSNHAFTVSDDVDFQRLQGLA